MRFIQFALLCVALLFSTLAFGASVNVNTATASEIAEAATGIGPVKAQAVVKYRKAHGAFSSIDGLKKVKGIGPATVNDNRSVLAVGEDNASSEGSAGK